MLEEEASHPTGAPFPDDDQRCVEAEDIEVRLKLLCVPHLTVLLSESLMISTIAVDLLDHGAADRLGRVGHVGLLL